MKNKKTVALSIISFITLLITMLGATYAYFRVSGGNSTSANVSVTTYTSDVLTFEVGEQINIETNQTLFASGKGNATGETHAKTILIANSKNNTATKNYYLYLDIFQNDFEYTEDTNTPEILLTITDSVGSSVTNIAGLTYKTVTDAKGNQVSGYDITTKRGLITLINNRSITASPRKEEQWNIKITFVNYNFDQSVNAGKKMAAKILLQKEEKMTIAQACDSGDTLSDCVVELSTKKDSEYTKIYKHDVNLTNGAGDNSYRYAGYDPDNYVCFGSSLTPCPTDNLYRIIGIFNGKAKLIKYDYASTSLLGTNGDYASDYNRGATSYKGSNYDNIAAYNWNYKNDVTVNDGHGSNTWGTSLLNTVNLNTNFITYLNNQNTKWVDLIAESTWKVGGNTWTTIAAAKSAVAYQNEVTSPLTKNTTDNKTEYTDQIGLMYVSDYGYAASPSAWTKNLTSYNSATQNNWMYMGLYEWTITRYADTFYRVFYLVPSGELNVYYSNIGAGVRPVFYLKADVKYLSGSGEMFNPIRLNLQ